VRYGGVSELDALKMITINPAIQLGIDKRVGTIELGKEADLALWSAHPLSIYAIADITWVDGVKRFDRMTDPADMRLRVSAEGKFSDTVASVSGRHEDSCMQGVLDFFTFEQMEHSHDH
jgi:cytosine/adenosine deaminase-related metal-dependent hydrolase